jgi:hypothetical protein
MYFIKSTPICELELYLHVYSTYNSPKVNQIYHEMKATAL